MAARDPETGQFTSGTVQTETYDDLTSQYVESVALITDSAPGDANIQGDFALTPTGQRIDSDQVAELVAVDRQIHIQVVNQGLAEENPGRAQWVYWMAQNEEFGNELFQNNPGEGDLIESGSAGTAGGSGTSDPDDSQVSSRDGRLDVLDHAAGQFRDVMEDTANATGGIGGPSPDRQKFMNYRTDLGVGRGPMFTESDDLDVRLQFFKDGVENDITLQLRAVLYWEVHEGEISFTLAD